MTLRERPTALGFIVQGENYDRDLVEHRVLTSLEWTRAELVRLTVELEKLRHNIRVDRGGE